jgi:AcrR family transcriptional regulator
MTRRARGDRPITRDPDGTRKALIRSAVSLFEHRGYAGTSVQSIVDDAGLTKGAFYHHFDSKDDLLLEVHDEFIDHQLERARDVLARDIPVDEQLRALVTEALFEPLSVYKSEISVFIQERRFLPDDVFAEIKDKRDAFERCVIEVVERGMADGTFRAAGPARLVAFGVIGMSAWAYTWLDTEGDRTPTEIGDLYGDILVDGLMTGAPGRAAVAAGVAAAGAE